MSRNDTNAWKKRKKSDFTLNYRKKNAFKNHTGEQKKQTCFLSGCASSETKLLWLNPRQQVCFGCGWHGYEDWQPSELNAVMLFHVSSTRPWFAFSSFQGSRCGIMKIVEEGGRAKSKNKNKVAPRHESSKDCSHATDGVQHLFAFCVEPLLHGSSRMALRTRTRRHCLLWVNN